MGYQTLSDDNQFAFKCPIFNADTKISACIKLRNLVWKGRIVEKRKGCQACMSAGKCPAAQIAQRMAMSSPHNPVADDYGSKTPVKGKLRKDILERILPVMVLSSDLQRFGPSRTEINLIETANERISAMMGSAPGASASKATIKGKARRNKKLADPNAGTTKNQNETKITKAAATGDLSAAL